MADDDNFSLETVVDSTVQAAAAEGAESVVPTEDESQEGADGGTTEAGETEPAATESAEPETAAAEAVDEPQELVEHATENQPEVDSIKSDFRMVEVKNESPETVLANQEPLADYEDETPISVDEYVPEDDASETSSATESKSVVIIDESTAEEPEAPEVTKDEMEPFVSDLDKQADELRKRRMSKRFRRKSTVYDLGFPTITGDFTVKKEETVAPEPIFSPSVSSVMGEGLEEEGEPELPKINRDEYIEMYTNLIEERKNLRRKNNYLHKKMVEHLKKRKLEHLLKESIAPEGIDLLDKYNRRLKMFNEVIEWEHLERDRIADDLHQMEEKLKNLKETLEKAFDSFVKREKEIALGLIDTKTGKVISDKLVERLIHRQCHKKKEISQIRLTCIKIRDRVMVKEASLRCVETLGNNLHLVDYEQLRMENQNYGDKIEERDDELGRLREKSATAIQVLAHIREKSYATAMDINDLMKNVKEVEADVVEARENLNELKMRRDSYRTEAVNLRDASGLLTHTKLLRDFENTIEEVHNMSDQLVAVQNSYEMQKNELTNIRKTLEGDRTAVQVIMKPKILIKKAKVYRGRPTLYYPSLPSTKPSTQVLQSILSER